MHACAQRAGRAFRLGMPRTCVLVYMRACVRQWRHASPVPGQPSACGSFTWHRTHVLAHLGLALILSDREASLDRHQAPIVPGGGGGCRHSRRAHRHTAARARMRRMAPQGGHGPWAGVHAAAATCSMQRLDAAPAVWQCHTGVESAGAMGAAWCCSVWVHGAMNPQS